MDRIDEYLQTLRALLPRDKREDILQELSEEMRSQAAEQEADLGRPLTPTEQAEMLRKYGHPLLTAARYRPQRYLIGPVVFPYYALTLKVILAFVVAGHAIGAVVLLVGGQPVGPALLDMVGAVLSGVGWFTLLAACADYWLTRSRVLEKWDPNKTSSPVSQAAEGLRNALDAVPRPGRAIASGDSLRDKPSAPRFVASVGLGAWWLLGLRFPYLFFGPGAAHLSWGEAMDRLYPILVLGQVVMLVQAYRELRGAGPMRSGWLAGVASGVVAALLLYLVATSDHQWLVWHGQAEAAARATVVIQLAGRSFSVIDFVNGVFSATFFLVALAAVIGSVRSLIGRLSGGGRRAAHA